MSKSSSKNLREYCNDFIAFKRASGFKVVKLEKTLLRYISYAEKWEKELTTVTKESAIKWENLSPEESPTNQIHRKNAVLQFANYLNQHEITAYIYPKFKYVSSNFTPYIFSNEELAKLFDACDNTLTPNLVRSYVVSLLFRMIYSCGLRVSEAINLTVRDVDLVQGILHIKETKFDKERLLPVHDDLLARIKLYFKKVHTYSGQDAPFFPNPRREFYNTSSVYSMFRERLWAAKISHGGKGHGPRVHDLRHTFAVHYLRRMVLNGEDLSVDLKYLSVYMGHTSITSTQHYLRLTADIYPHIVCKMEKEFDVLPDLEVLYENI